MPNTLHILLRILAGVAGALLLYVALFLFEDEEERVQNRLEQIWQKINALQSTAMSREVAFLQGVTRTTSAILDRLLGHKRVSLQSIAVSMAFSLASLFVWFPIIDRPQPVIPHHGLVTFYGLFLFLLGSLPALALAEQTSRRATLVRKSYCVGLIILMIGSPWLLLKYPLASYDVQRLSYPFEIDILFFLLFVLPGMSLDVYFIIVFRWALEKIAGFSELWTIISCFMVVSVAVVLLTGPALLVAVPSLWSHFFSPHLYQLSSTGRAAFLVGIVCMSNLIDALCLILLILVMATLLAHRLLWPFIKRPIYAAKHKQLIKNTKLLGGLGTMLLLYAFPNNAVVKWITHFLPNLRGG